MDRDPGSGAIAAALRRAFEAAAVAFCKLNRIQFSAPWNPRPGRC